MLEIKVKNIEEKGPETPKFILFYIKDKSLQ